MTANELIVVSEQEKAYAAGLIDGEGCIRIARSRGTRLNYFTQVQVATTTPQLTRWLHERWGGSLRQYNAVGQRKAVTIWQVSTANAVHFLNDIEPYLVLKKEQSLHVRNFQTLFGRGGCCLQPAGRRSVEGIVLRDRIHDHVRDLKKQSPSKPTDLHSRSFPC